MFIFSLFSDLGVSEKGVSLRRRWLFSERCCLARESTIIPSTVEALITPLARALCAHFSFHTFFDVHSFVQK